MTGSVLGIVVDLVGFWALVHGGVGPGAANALSSTAAVVAVHVLVTRRIARAPLSVLVVLVAGYALDIVAVSVLIEHAVVRFGDRPMLFKCVLLPFSFVACAAFSVMVRNRSTGRVLRRGAGVVLGVLLLLIAMNVGTAPSATAAAAPRRLADLFSSGSGMLGRSIVIGGLGSSVGAGAALADPAVDAPVAHFASAVTAMVDPGAMARWRVVNDSVNGSTIHDGLSRDWPVLKTERPDVVVLAYGMNDGTPSQFDSGETYAGAMHDLVELVHEIRAAGAIPVLLTSPSPHTRRFDFDYVGGPVTPQQAPVDTSSPVLEEVVAGHAAVPFSSRHAAVNQGMRLIAADYDVDLVDVEPAWVEAVATRGQDALFGPTEFVHPNLLGHRLGYHAAIDRWTRSALDGWLRP